MVPGGAGLALMVLGCAVVGVVAGGRLGQGLGAIAAFLIAGQALGHVILSFLSAHGHALSPSPGMLTAHLVAAVLCAALISAAERLWSALAGYVWRLVRALTAAAPADQVCRRVAVEHTGRPRTQLGCTAGTRGPPLSFA